MEYSQGMAVSRDDRQHPMNSPERWQELKDILYSALEVERNERAAFLDEKCGDDDELRREVESLIKAHDAAESLESPALEKIAAGVSDDAAYEMTGKSLGHYEVIEKIGCGGMGE